MRSHSPVKVGQIKSPPHITSLSRILSDLGHASVPKQLAAGGAAGWVSGYLTMKAGKMAATAIGGTLLLLQIAHHKGYIKVR